MRQGRVFLLPGFAEQADIERSACVVVDVIRATTTISCALAAGAQRVIPVERVEQIDPLRSRLGGDVVTGGERGGRPIPGLDLGNSPREYTPETVGGRTVLLTTTNGTRAILAVSRAARVFVGALINAAACARTLAEAGGDVAVVCAGTEGEAALDDTLAAGVILRKLIERVGPIQLDDAARLAVGAAEAAANDLPAAVRASAAARKLERIGLASDLDDVVRVDRLDVVGEVCRSESLVEIVPCRINGA